MKLPENNKLPTIEEATTRIITNELILAGFRIAVGGFCLRIAELSRHPQLYEDVTNHFLPPGVRENRTSHYGFSLSGMAPLHIGDGILPPCRGLIIDVETNPKGYDDNQVLLSLYESDTDKPFRVGCEPHGELPQLWFDNDRLGASEENLESGLEFDTLMVVGTEPEGTVLAGNVARALFESLAPAVWEEHPLVGRLGQYH